MVKYGSRIHHPPSHHHHRRRHLINRHCHDQAAATVSCEDRPNIAAEYMGRAGRLYVRIKKYDEAVSDDHDDDKDDDDVNGDNAEDEDGDQNTWAGLTASMFVS